MQEKGPSPFRVGGQTFSQMQGKGPSPLNVGGFRGTGRPSVDGLGGGVGDEGLLAHLADPEAQREVAPAREKVGAELADLRARGGRCGKQVLTRMCSLRILKEIFRQDHLS